jgi:excisionase family DNA binding protein
MNPAAMGTFADRMPTAVEIEHADGLRTILASLIKEDRPTELDLIVEESKTAHVTLAPAIAQTFLEVLRLISSGRGFRLIPVNAELTTQQAADLLNVSRPFLIKLLEEQRIPFTKTGRHRRIRAEELFRYKDERDGRRAHALAAMAKFDADEGLI